MIAGTIYGVVLNDRPQHEQMADSFAMPPYKAAPQAPVLYIKTRNCLMAAAMALRWTPILLRLRLPRHWP